MMRIGMLLVVAGILCGVTTFFINDMIAEKVLMFGAGWNLALGFCIAIIHKMELL